MVGGGGGIARGSDGRDRDTGNLKESVSKDLQCTKCLKVFVSVGNKNHHEAKCNPQKRKSKRKIQEVYQSFQLRRNDKLTELLKKIPCNYLRFLIASTTNTFVPDCYPPLFNVTTDLGFKKVKLDIVCRILADASSHQEEGIRIPKYFGEF